MIKMTLCYFIAILIGAAMGYRMGYRSGANDQYWMNRSFDDDDDF